MLACPERIYRNRRLVLVILAPVHQHFAFAEFLLHIGDHQVAVLILQQPRQSVGKWLGAFITGGDV